MLTDKQLRAQALKRLDVAAEFDEQINEFLRARSKQGLTQDQVAQRDRYHLVCVARMESGRRKHSHSLATLSKYVEVTELRSHACRRQARYRFSSCGPVGPALSQVGSLRGKARR